jgi:hypothetical protein
MTDTLARLLEATHQPGLPELRQVLDEILAGSGAPALAVHQLKPRVLRLELAPGGSLPSLVLKRLDPATALHNQRVIRRWLPSIGLGDVCPALLGVAAERGGLDVWHVYEDLGDFGLARPNMVPPDLEAAVDLIARLHVRSAEHAILPECRQLGGDLGIHYFASNVRDAIRALAALKPWNGHDEVRDRLLGRLLALQGDLPRRARAMEAQGGPEVLLHGDLWTINAFVLPGRERPTARLIDWDHAGVGPVTYDLSTFLYRLPSDQRSWLLHRYRSAVEHAGWRLPAPKELNLLFDTAEQARYANRAIWPALAIAQGGENSWGFEELLEVDRWFEDLEPVLPA